jgi:hypothetical protein
LSLEPSTIFATCGAIVSDIFSVLVLKQLGAARDLFS